MTINVTYRESEYVPVWYFDRINKVVTTWEWVTREVAHRKWFVKDMTNRYGKNWNTEEDGDWEHDRQMDLEQ